MTSATSNDDTTREDTARLGKRKRKREKENDALRSELEAFNERVRGLEARVRETEARVEVVETQRDAMRAELEEMRRTLEKEVKATRFGFSSLPLDVIASIVEKHLPDPADVAVLRAVSKGTRDAVDATGRKVEEFEEDDAVERGYLSTLKCLRRRGRLSDERVLCAAAARIGDLEALKALRRAENFPWDERTCTNAAYSGHLEVLQWARENDCPWDEGRAGTRRTAATSTC
jgi:DNA repair exonuclease SbcCD ATPase subunit